MKYRKIDTRIWNDEKFMSLSDGGKLTFFFILTHPHLTPIGAMRATIPGLAAELRWDLETFSLAFRETISKGMIEHDNKASFLWIPNFIKYNKPESVNCVKAWSSSLDLLPECTLKYKVLKHTKESLKDLHESFQNAFNKTLAKELERLSKIFNHTSVGNQSEVLSDKQLDAIPDGIRDGIGYAMAYPGAGTGAGTGTGITPYSPPFSKGGCVPSENSSVSSFSPKDKTVEDHTNHPTPSNNGKHDTSGNNGSHGTDGNARDSVEVMDGKSICNDNGSTNEGDLLYDLFDENGSSGEDPPPKRKKKEGRYSPEDVKKYSPQVQEIIDYCNQKWNTRHTACDATMRFIIPRLKEGYGVEDFKTVVDKKTRQWLKDEKMCKYLRVSTLFAFEKFPDYLNEIEKGNGNGKGVDLYKQNYREGIERLEQYLPKTRDKIN